MLGPSRKPEVGGAVEGIALVDLAPGPDRALVVEEDQTVPLLCRSEGLHLGDREVLPAVDGRRRDGEAIVELGGGLQDRGVGTLDSGCGARGWCGGRGGCGPQGLGRAPKVRRRGEG